MRAWLTFTFVLFVTLATKEHVQACQDLGDCTKFASKCSQDGIKKICPKTCGACRDINSVCKDLGDCTKLASKCDQKGVEEICPKTCGTCREVSPAISCGIPGTPPCNTAPESACEDFGDCSKLASKCDQKGVKEICPKTCGTCRKVSPVISCGIPGTPPCNTAPENKCKDLGDCSKLATKCNQEGVKEICPKTCGICREVNQAISCGIPGTPSCNTAPESRCEDFGDCSKLAIKCDQKGVKEICPRTCGTCRVVTPVDSCGTPGKPPCNTASKTDCKDQGDCSKLVSKCGEKGVRDICPKTCGTCKEVTSVSSCKDASPLCGAMASSCSVDTVQKMCVKTCDLCSKIGNPVGLIPPTVDCKDDNTLCSKLADDCNDEEVRKQCRKTCRACGAPVICYEKNELCHKLVDFCHEELVQKNCPNTCKLCARIRSANCEDTNPLCSQLKTSCGDESVRKVCGKTCGCN